MATATYAGTNYALKVTQKVGTWPVAAHCNSAKVYCMSDECYADSVGTAGSFFYFNKIPAGAVPLISVIWPIDSTDVSVGGDAMAAAVTGQLGTVAVITDKGDTVAADPDLFGDVAALTTATPQVIEPCPDGTIYTTTLDFALTTEKTPVMLTAAQSLADTEGVALKMLYTMGGRTF